MINLHANVKMDLCLKDLANNCNVFLALNIQLLTHPLIYACAIMISLN